MNQTKIIALSLVVLFLVLTNSVVIAGDFGQTSDSSVKCSSYTANMQKILKNKDQEIADKFLEAKKWVRDHTIEIKENTVGIGKAFKENIAKWKAEIQKMVQQMMEKFNEIRNSYYTLL